MSEPTRPAGGFSVGHTALAGATILSPSASLTFENCKEMRAALETAASEHGHAVVLDCRSVSYMDSEALEMLVEMHEKLSAARVSLRLTHLNEVCMDILTASRLVHVLIVYGDLSQALRGA